MSRDEHEPCFSGWFTLAEVRSLAIGFVPDAVKVSMRRAVGLLDGTMQPVATDPAWSRPRSPRRGSRRSTQP